MKKNDNNAAQAPEPCLNLSLKRADRAISLIYNHHLAKSGLTNSQFAILRALKFLGECTSQVIKNILVTDQTTLSRNLKLLVNAGHVLMIEDAQDRRKKNLSLSTSGKKLFKAGEKNWELAQAQLKEQLGPKLAKQVITLSDAITLKMINPD